MTKLNPYLNFDGNAEEAFNHYRSIFGGEFLGEIHRMGDSFGSENIPEAEKKRVMHIALPIGNDLLMASDIMPSAGQKLTEGNNNYICVSPDSRDEATRIFDALAKGGTVEMPIEDQFWGDYFGSLIDKFGVYWMISFSKTA